MRVTHQSSNVQFKASQRPQHRLVVTHFALLAITAPLALGGCNRAVTVPPAHQDRSPTEGQNVPVTGSMKSSSDDASSLGDVWFIDKTHTAGLRFEHQRGPTRYWLPEIMGSGAAWIDYDNDGDPDLYLVQGGDIKRSLASDSEGRKKQLPGNVLYRNNGDGTFTDVTKSARVGDRQYGMGATVGDANNDGWLDLYVTNVGPNRLYINQGDGTFEEVGATAGVDHDGWGTAAAFVDYNQDKHTDLLLVNYVQWSERLEEDCRTNDNLRDYCSPLTYEAPAVDALYRNNGDGSFSDVTLSCGLAHAYGNGLGAVVADFDSDGRLDFYVANDGMPNQLWLQDDSGRFQNRSLEMGCAVNAVGAAEAGMGVAAFDLENDSDLDLFMTHLANETNTLYVNHQTYFEDRTSISQLAATSFAYTGFGLSVVDFDHDGNLDLYIANGRVGRDQEAIVADDVFAEPNQLLRGLGNGRFAEVPRAGLAHALVETSRAVAMADYDLDGDVDVLVTNNGGSVRLLANQKGDKRRSFRFRLRDDAGLDAVAARVGLEVAEADEADTIQWRLVSPACGYLSGHEMDVHFGLNEGQAARRLHIIWPNGRRETRSLR